MFSDTHFHFENIVSGRGLNGKEILTTMANRDCFFGLDIGTRCDDLLHRQKFIEETAGAELEGKLGFINYSAGIWPDVDEIHDRHRAMKVLEESIAAGKKIVAVGECGIDHHWNPSGVDGRCESDFDKATYEGERELFEMQLELGRKLNLPVIIHSRDGFQDTLDCIKNCGYHNGIIHCYSYGIEEARAFLDLGWYISFSGSVTYTKKAKMEEMENLLRFVPEDRILCETDAPYLAPVPYRGQPNSPVFVEEVYKFVAAARNTTAEALSNLVDENVKTLFRV
ncbi:MAG: TatD family hydrolase [Treponema sp.]|nr:TatD family hydrolase [Treponema sp.]